MFQELLDFQEGRLAPETSVRVKEHLASGCPKCGADRAWYERLRSVARSDSSFAPPDWVRERAILLFEEERENSAFEGFEFSEIARLAYDSLKDRAVVGARSSEGSDRQLVYSAAGYSVDLQIGSGEASGAIVIGQVLQERQHGFHSVTGLLVDLLRHEESIWSTVTNSVGEFRMIGVELGEYDLTIDTLEGQIRIPNLPILL